MFGCIDCYLNSNIRDLGYFFILQVLTSNYQVAAMNDKP